MTTIRVERRDRWTTVSNAAVRDSSLSFRARGILVWLLSQPDDWRTNSEAIAAETPEGRDAVRTAMKELETAGYLTREKIRKEGGRFETVLTFRESPAPGNPASVNQSSVSQASNEEPRQMTENEESPSLRSGELEVAKTTDVTLLESTVVQSIARDYWDWFVEEHGGRPVQSWDALKAIITRCLKSEYPGDEILDAMKVERRNLTAAWVIDRIGRTRRERENRPSTAAIPSTVVRAFADAKPFLNEYASTIPWSHCMDAVSRLVHQGHGIGEAMIRLAIGLREPRLHDPWWLRNIDIPRFTEGLDDYADAMTRAYVNRTWRVA